MTSAGGMAGSFAGLWGACARVRLDPARLRVQRRLGFRACFFSSYPFRPCTSYLKTSLFGIMYVNLDGPSRRRILYANLPIGWKLVHAPSAKLLVRRQICLAVGKFAILPPRPSPPPHPLPPTYHQRIPHPLQHRD